MYRRDRLGNERWHHSSARHNAVVCLCLPTQRGTKISGLLCLPNCAMIEASQHPKLWLPRRPIGGTPTGAKEFMDGLGPLLNLQQSFQKFQTF